MHFFGLSAVLILSVIILIKVVSDCFSLHVSYLRNTVENPTSVGMILGGLAFFTVLMVVVI